MMKIFSVVIALLFSLATAAQTKKYTTANAHSHNDYENKFPFETACNEMFGSIEADIFLWHDSLIVGHTQSDIQYKRTLENLYLGPLLKSVVKNNYFPYKDHSRKLQLLIDIKTEAVATLDKLITVLKKYPAFTRSHQIQFVITGNRPAASTWNNYPSFILFDGELQKNYTAAVLNKIALFSDNLKNYTQWNGNDTLPKTDKLKIDAAITKAHSLGKKVRFWNAPDFVAAWQQFIDAGVDYINTDHIIALAAYLSNLK